MEYKTYTITLLVLIIIIFGSYIIKNNPDNEATNINNNLQKAPDFSLPDYDGNLVSSSDFLGKPLIVNSWTTWCPFCVNELPDFAKVQNEFKDKINIVAINRKESKEISKKFSDNINISDNLIFLLDSSDSYYQSIGGFSMPETLYINENGFILLHKRGPITADDMRNSINTLFNL